ncbi:MAG: translocation/assembly module TamB domain-containing protein, partial [Candidatus Omnitrophota bacterium]
MGFIRFIIIFLTSFIMAVAVAAAFLLCTPWGVSLLVGSLSSRLLGPGKVTFERVEGSILRGMRVFNVELRQPFVLAEGSQVRIQELNMRIRQLSINGLETEIINARILSDTTDPVVANGAFSESKYDVNVFSQSLDLAVLRKVIRHFRNPPILHGALKNLDLVLSGDFAHPALKGNFVVDHIPQNGFVLQDVPVRCDLNFTRMGGLWGTFGRMFVQKGWIRGPRSLMRLEESRLIFTGDPRNPELEIHASSFIARTHIQITVRGTRREPRVALASEPQLPQEQLMLMLTTGKRWDSLSTLPSTGRMTSEVAGDFVDYFFFGGSGQRVAHFFGLSSISYRIDSTKQGVVFNKDITDRLGVGYGVAVDTSAVDQENCNHKCDR